jgi:hypothetical protein
MPDPVSQKRQTSWAFHTRLFPGFPENSGTKNIDSASPDSRLLLRHADGTGRIGRKQHESMDPFFLVSTIQIGGGNVPPSNLQQLCDAIASKWTNIPVERFRLVTNALKNSSCSKGKGGTDEVLDGCT